MDKKKTRIQEMGLKLKKVMYRHKNEDICNFTFISGYEKSRINKMRYCLHQLTMETDHTQAMMDFIRLVFQVVPISKLKSTPDQFLIQMKQNNGGYKYSFEKKGLMSGFLERFRVKRDISSCLREYTLVNFFARIVNNGLRLFRNPYQLVYLRLPFSHIFWSIKFLYHRHKRAIFQHKQHKNKDRTIRLFRGSSINEEEVKQLRMNVGSYIEAEGFLSTSLLPRIANLFSTNLEMTIHVPVSNLKGMFDNGFAHIFKFQCFEGEEEVLINAFNVFKVLSFKKVGFKQQLNVLVLQYGGVKAVEEQVRKSEEVLDKEFLWKEGQRQIQLIQHKLDVNQENMSKEWHRALSNRLKEGKKEHGERKKRLEAQTKEEYEHAVTQLTQWDKELLLNTQHQLSQITCIQSFGDLLWKLNEWREGCIYMRRRMKQMEAERAIEGIHWRNNHSLIQQLCKCTQSLHKCYDYMGRVEDSWAYKQKLLHLYTSINMEKHHRNYYRLLYDIYVICDEMAGMEKKQKKYKNKLIGILEQYQLTNTQEQKLIKQHESKERQMKKMRESQREEKRNETIAQNKQRKQQQQKRKQTLASMKQQLQHVRLFTYGLYTFNYLQQLWKIIDRLHLWGWWKSVIRQGNRYIQIRSQTPHVQYRRYTCNVLGMMLDGCVQVGSRKELQVICGHITSFIPHNIYNKREYQLVLYCIRCCLRLQCWRPARQLLFTLKQSNIKCKLSQWHVHDMMLYGYVLLLSSVSEVDYFLPWATTLYQQQSYTNTWQYKKILQHMISYNDEYNSRDKGVHAERKKEYHDANIIEFVHEGIKKGEEEWSEYTWEERRRELIGWQHPFYLLDISMVYSVIGLDQYLEKGQVGMCILHCQQLNNKSSNILNEHNSRFNLNRVNVVSKLHKNKDDFITIPSLLSFSSDVTQLCVVQMQMGIDVEGCVSNTQHLREDTKQQRVHLIRYKWQTIKNGMAGLQMGRKEVKWMRAVGRRCSYIQQATIGEAKRREEANTMI